MSNLSFALCILPFAGVISIFILALAKHHRRKQLREVGFDEVIPFLTPTNLATLLELTNPQNEKYLRSSVSKSEFRVVQRRRVRLLIEITKRILRNTGLLQDLAASQLYSCNPLMAKLAEELIDVGATTRMYSLFALTRLYLRKVVLALGPFAFSTRLADFEKMVASDLVPAYECLKSKAAHFALLRSAALLEPLMQNL